MKMFCLIQKNLPIDYLTNLEVKFSPNFIPSYEKIKEIILYSEIMLLKQCKL